MNNKRPSDREYDRFSDDLKDKVYEQMGSVKGLMASFIVDDKIEFGKKTGFALEGIRSLVEKELGIILEEFPE